MVSLIPSTSLPGLPPVVMPESELFPGVAAALPTPTVLDDALLDLVWSFELVYVGKTVCLRCGQVR